MFDVATVEAAILEKKAYGRLRFSLCPPIKIHFPNISMFFPSNISQTVDPNTESNVYHCKYFVTTTGRDSTHLKVVKMVDDTSDIIDVIGEGVSFYSL